MAKCEQRISLIPIKNYLDCDEMEDLYMSRQQKKPDYNSVKIMQDYMAALVDAYGAPYDDRILAEEEHISLNEVAAEFGITAMKARKLLITAGVYSTGLSRKIQLLYSSGRSISEIQSIIGLSRSSIHSYLPYSKGTYNMEELSTNAERTKLYRERKAVVKELQDALKRGYCIDTEELLWNVLLIYQGYTFHTIKGLKFTYHIKGNEMFVNRKEKSITKATINMAFRKAMELGSEVTGPKKLGTFGASYLYVIFGRIGVIRLP